MANQPRKHHYLPQFHLTGFTDNGKADGEDGTWVIEGGPGVRPDIEVIDDPARMANGHDPQLEAAIKLMLEEIKKHPSLPSRRPPSPDRRGMGLRADGE